MIRRELGVFLIVGFMTVLIDFVIYRGLLYIKPLNFEDVNLAKGLSFIGGTIFAYFANRFWTFNQRITGAGSVGRFLLVYLFGLAINIGVNFLAISWFNRNYLTAEYSLVTAFIFATGISAAINFLGMKFFVFTERQHAE